MGKSLADESLLDETGTTTVPVLSKIHPMTNIAFQDRAGGTVRVYSANAQLPKWKRISAAIEDLQHMGNIIIYLHKRGKLRKIKVKGF
jgi:hypothetical protein